MTSKRRDKKPEENDKERNGEELKIHYMLLKVLVKDSSLEPATSAGHGDTTPRDAGQ